MTTDTELRSLKTVRFIKVRLDDGNEIRATRHQLPDTGDPMDVTCPRCQEKQWKHQFDLVQWGFMTDLNAAVMRCANCSHDIFVVMEIDVEGF